MSEITVRLNDSKPQKLEWKTEGRYFHITIGGEERWDVRKTTASMEVLHRHTESAQVVRENPRTMIVRLPDGNVVKRKKWRDVA